MDIRDSLRDYIREKGYRQSIIASKADLTESQLSAILHKKRRLDANELFASSLLFLTPEQLMAFNVQDTA